MMNTSISVVLPAYFREMTDQNSSFLKRALDSVGSQKFPSEFEILLIDDGSPTPVELPKTFYGDIVNKVRLIRLENNLGLVNALNTGIINAKFPLIARIDSDDWWDSNKIEKQVSYFHNDSDLSLVASGMTRYEYTGQSIDTHIRNGGWVEILNFFINIGCPFPHGSILARKEIFELLGLYPHDARYIHCEDYALWGIWLRFFKTKIIEESHLNYTVWDNSVSHRNSLQQQQASRIVQKKFAEYVNPNKLPSALTKLSQILGITLIQAGKLAYMLWRYDLFVRLPGETITILRNIIPDRLFIANATSQNVISWQDLIGLSKHTKECKLQEISGRFYKF